MDELYVFLNFLPELSSATRLSQIKTSWKYISSKNDTKERLSLWIMIDGYLFLNGVDFEGRPYKWNSKVTSQWKFNSKSYGHNLLSVGGERYMSIFSYDK